MVASAGNGLPDPGECREAGDEGKLYHDFSNDIWYECIFDVRTSSRGWTALPPSDGDPES